jgi:hypothetical protein
MPTVLRGGSSKVILLPQGLIYANPKKARHEKFAQARFEGKTANDSRVAASQES